MAATSATISREAPKLLQNFRYSFVRRLNSASSSPSPLSSSPFSTVQSLNLSEKNEEPTITITTNPVPPPIITTTTPTVDLTDVSRLFQSVSTPKLLRSSFNLHMAALDPMVDLGTWVMGSRLMETPLARDVVLRVIRHTFFEHFVAGESPAEAGRTVERMWNEAGLRGMMVYGLEHAHDNESCDRNLKAFLDTVEVNKSLPRDCVSSVVVKITAICPMSLLKRVSHLLRWQHKNLSFHLPWKVDTLPILSDSSPFYHTPSQPEPLSPQEEHDLQIGLGRLHKLCQACQEANIPLSVDAEDTIVQPSIDYFTYSSAIMYNKGNNPIIFGTIQTYLKDAKDRLLLLINAAEKMGVSIAIKLVRGAYMSSEEQLATSSGVESPIHKNIQDTHNCYNECLCLLLDMISNGWRGSVVLATHNIDSGKMAATKAREMGIRVDNERLQFAQLYGMSEALSFGLRNAGFIVSKYMPFGPIDLVLPYLLRRAEENRGLLSSSTLDRTLMRKELMRRLKDAIL